jgi:hypothetical protein
LKSIDGINLIAERIIQALVFSVVGFLLGLGLLEILEVLAAGKPACG